MLLIYSLILAVICVALAVTYLTAYFQANDYIVRRGVWHWGFLNMVLAVIAWFLFPIGVYDIGVPAPTAFGAVILIGFSGFSILLVRDTLKLVNRPAIG